MKLASNCLRSSLLLIVQKYETKNVFNADKTGLILYYVPNKIVTFKGQSCSVGYTSKERTTYIGG